MHQRKNEAVWTKSHIIGSRQLEFEHFTREQAVYGVDNCGADWE